MSHLNQEIVVREFKNMELQAPKKTTNPLPNDKIKAIFSKIPSSFVGGKWLVETELGKEPWIHVESSPHQKTYWKNATASEEWRKLSSIERAEHIGKISSTIESHATALTEMATNPRPDLENIFMKEFLPALARYIRFYAGAACQDNNLFGLEPYGCVAVVVNRAYHSLGAMWAAAPALAAGNTVNIVAYEKYRPLLLLAQLICSAGFPAGVLNVIICSSALEETIPSDNGLPTVMFELFQSAQEAGLEDFVNAPNFLINLEGRSHMLILQNADIEAAVDAVITNTFEKVFIVPWVLTEVLVEEPIFARFVSRLRMRYAAMETQYIHVSNDENKKIKKNCLENANEVLGEHAPFILIGGRMPEPSNSWSQESLPPVAVLPIRSSQEAIGIINSRQRILSASVWTEDGALGLRVAKALQVGIVWLNQHSTLFHPAARFGNWNLGGWGHFGGKEALFDYLKCKPILEQQKDSISVKISNAGAKLQDMDLRFGLYYDGQFKENKSQKLIFDLQNKPMAIASIASQKDLESAVAAAFKAQATWKAKSAFNKAEALLCISQAMEKEGKTYINLCKRTHPAGEKMAQVELRTAKEILFKWSCLTDKINGEVIGDGSPGTCLVFREPIGIIGICGSTSSSTLDHMIALLAPALATGNTVVLAASESNPLPALFLAKLLQSMNLPTGLLNIIYWSGSEESLAKHEDVTSLWIGEGPQQAKLNSSLFKQVWRIPNFCKATNFVNDVLIHHCIKNKTVIL